MEQESKNLHYIIDKLVNLVLAIEGFFNECIPGKNSIPGRHSAYINGKIVQLGIAG